MAKEQVEFNRQKYADAQARQAQQDAKHAHEKIAAAFQRIGAMVAGSRSGGSAGGQVGGFGGEQDSSAFRMAPTPQRTPPRVGNAPQLTRYGGPVKRNQ